MFDTFFMNAELFRECSVCHGTSARARARVGECGISGVAGAGDERNIRETSVVFIASRSRT